jgi:hypothetical protein
MGEYANPTGYVDTQTGQHFRDLATNITNIVGKASSDYIAQMKANAEERKKTQEKEAREKREADEVALSYQSDAAAVSNKNTKIDFSKTFDENTNKVRDLSLKNIQGNITPEEKAELNTLRLSPGGVSAFIGTFADVGTGFAENYKKDFGTAGSVDRFFNAPELIESLKAGTGLNPKVKGTGFTSKYNPETKQMENSMSFEIEGQDPLIIGDALINQIETKGANIVLKVPDSQDAGIAYNASQATIWEKTKAGKDGKPESTGVLNESFKITSTTQDNKPIEYKGRTVVNGVAYQDTDLTITNGKVTNSTRTYFQQNDMSKLFTQKWEDQQKLIFAESTSDHELSVKSVYFNVFEPKLAAMAADKYTTPEDKKKIEEIQKAFGLISKDGKPNRDPVTPEQKNMAELAHIMIQKDILTKQYEFTPVLNDDGSVKTEVVKKVEKKSGKTKAGAEYVAANTGTTVQDVLANGSIDKIPVYFNGTKQSGVVEMNDDGTYNVSTSIGGTIIAKNKTYAEMKEALESVTAKKAKKAKK